MDNDPNDHSEPAASDPALPLPEVPGYEIDNLLELGRDGSVYRGRQSSSGQAVTIKLSSPTLFVTQDMRDRFLDEAQALTELEHPNIVRVIGFGEHNQQLWAAMERVAGESLAQYLEAGGFSTFEVQPLLEQVGSALEAAHAVDIVHGDIRPANILIGSDGQVRLTNFAMFGHGPVDEDTREGVAPEQRDQRDNPATFDWRSDIFSLGALGYQCLTAQVPTRGSPPPSTLNADIPPAVDKVVSRAMRANPEERPQSATEFLDEFSKAFQPPPPPNLGRRLGFAVLAVLFLGLLGGAAYLALKPDSLEQGLVLHYTFDEELTGASRVVADLSGQGHQGMAVGQAAFVAEETGGRSLRITNSTSYVQAAHPTLDTSNWTSGTFSVWTKLERFTPHNGLLYRGAEKDRTFALHFQLGGNGTYGSSPNTSYGVLAARHIMYSEQLNPNRVPRLALNTWHHFVGTWNDDGMSLYVNGVKDNAGMMIEGDAKRADKWFDHPDSVFWIGKSRRSQNGWHETFLNGWIDEVRLYNRPLEQKEILRLFKNNPNAGPPKKAIPLETHDMLHVGPDETIEAPATHRFVALRLRDSPATPLLELDGQSYYFQGILRANGAFEPTSFMLGFLGQNQSPLPESGEDSWVYLIPTNLPARAELVVNTTDVMGVKVKEVSRVPATFKPASENSRPKDTSRTDEISVLGVAWTYELVVGASRTELGVGGLASGKKEWEVRQATIRPEHGVLLVTVAFKDSERKEFWPKEFSIRSGKTNAKALSLMGPDGLIEKHTHKLIADAETFVLAFPAPPANARSELQFIGRPVKDLPQVTRSK